MIGRKLADDKALAAALGIESLGIGRGKSFRGEDKSVIAYECVDTLWILNVYPSFDAAGLVGVATAHVQDLQGNVSKGWIRGIISSGDTIWVTEIDTDPVPKILAHVKPMEKSDSAYCDGVGYLLQTQSSSLLAELNFWNPTVKGLTKLEMAALTLARSLAEKSDRGDLLRFVQQWERYVDRG